MNRKHRFTFLVLGTLMLLFLAGCGSNETQEEPAEITSKEYPEGTMAAVLAEDGRFLTFLELTDTLVGPHGDTIPLLIRTDEQNRTVWAPTDEAFDALPADLLEKLKSDEAIASEMFYHHLFDRELYSEDFSLLPTWPTFLTVVKVNIEQDGDEILYDGVRVIETDIQADNGVIHILDAVAGIELLTD